MSEKFTPGNWKVSDQREIPNMDYDYSIVDDGGWYIAHIENCSLKEQEANAHLIAAAPEMYALLKTIADPATFMGAQTNEALRTAIEVVLKKARGEA